ncbi:ComEC/Rec2 family competence protein [Micromonospora avicenniae]|uniref:ComEC/Rec2 family competence protein n=1 Tax=Micromonospora avicenniae TaxID=1198245 RepID=UPI00332BA266
MCEIADRDGMVVYEVDFLPVENENQDGGKSGDAITIRFTVEAEQREGVVVIDGGRGYTSETLVDHIERYYGTRRVDLMISTHPDADHLDGLAGVVEKLDVAELMIHQPRLHPYDVSDFSNLEALDELLATARARGARLTEPFTGASRFGGQLTVLGPTEGYYEDLLGQQLIEAKAAALSASAGTLVLQRGVNLLERHAFFLPDETLTDDGETSPRNNSSVITLLRVNNERMLFTGDAGIPALEAAAAYYEAMWGSFWSHPLSFLQAPHHGSRRNLGPTILNRLIGTPQAPHAASCTAFISSAKAAPKHPSPKVVNALTRRHCSVAVTEGWKICHNSADSPSRPGWVTLTPLPALVEDDD